MVREMVIGQKHFALAVSRMPTPNTVWHPHSGVIVARRRSDGGGGVPALLLDSSSSLPLASLAC